MIDARGRCGFSVAASAAARAGSVLPEVVDCSVPITVFSLAVLMSVLALEAIGEGAVALGIALWILLLRGMTFCFQCFFLYSDLKRECSIDSLYDLYALYDLYDGICVGSNVKAN